MVKAREESSWVSPTGLVNDQTDTPLMFVSLTTDKDSADIALRVHVSLKAIIAFGTIFIASLSYLVHFVYQVS